MSGGGRRSLSGTIGLGVGRTSDAWIMLRVGMPKLGHRVSLLSFSVIDRVPE